MSGNHPYKLLDLFSGLGGFSLGLERTGIYETVALCEYNEARWPILRKNWNHVPTFKDVKDIDGDILEFLRPDAICGGFPCQELSKAGRSHGVQKGFNGERSSLFYEIIRIARLVGGGLQRIILENVTDLLDGPYVDGKPTGEWFGVVLAELAEIGFDAIWEVIPAFSVGSIQRRERVVIIAYPAGQRVQGSLKSFSISKTGQGWSGRKEDLQHLCDHPFESGNSWPQPLLRGVDGWPANWMDRIEALGNCILPDVAQIAGEMSRPI